MSGYMALHSVNCYPPLQTGMEKVFVPGPTASKWQSQESAPTSGFQAKMHTPETE